MARRRNIVEILDQYTDNRDKRSRAQQRATVVAVTPTTALIKIGGSHQSQNAKMPSGDVVGVGDTVLVSRNESDPRVRWIINSIISKKGFSANQEAERAYTEIFPPANVEIVAGAQGAITVQWDVPVSYPVAFQVETDTLSDFSTSVSEVTTRGSYAIIPTAETLLYIRVRSIAPDGQTSQWTTISGSPETSSGDFEKLLTVYGDIVWDESGYFLTE